MSDDHATSTGRSSSRATARWRASSTPGPRRTSPHAHGRDVDAACRALVTLARRRRLARARRRRRGHGGAATTRSTPARSAWSARRWRATTAWPTSPSRCRAWAPARSAWPARRRRRRATCRASRGGEAIAAFALSEPDAGSDVAAHGLRRARRRRRATCSTARRPGSPTAASPTSTSCSPAPARPPGARGISRLHRRRRHARLRDRRAHRRDRAASAGAPALRRLPRAAERSASAPKARASRSRCARSTCSAPRSPPPRSASRAAPSTRRCTARPPARCSRRARRLPADPGQARRDGDRRSTAPRC